MCFSEDLKKLERAPNKIVKVFVFVFVVVCLFLQQIRPKETEVMYFYK